MQMCVCPNTGSIYTHIHMDCDMNGISESYRDVGDDFKPDETEEDTGDNKFRSSKWRVVKVHHSTLLLILK